MHKKEVLVKKKIERLDIRTVADIHRADFQVFSYRGTMIDIEIATELTLDDGIIFNTSFNQQTEVAFGPRPKVTEDPAALVEPDDEFNAKVNLRALPQGKRTGAWVALVAAAAVVGLKAMSGTAFARTLINAGSGLGLAVWTSLRKQLRRYMTVELRNVPQRIRPGDQVEVSRIIGGAANVDLFNVIVRVVAANFELGQYVRGAGKSRHVESFSRPVRAVVLYEGFIKRIPAGTMLDEVLEGTIDFDRMFASLYPPQRIGKYHGLTIHWEVQVLHREYVDQELVGPVEPFEWRDFLMQ